MVKFVFLIPPLNMYREEGVFVLIGEYSCAMDEKGRLNFPVKLREEMGEDFIITRWLDDCLIAFPSGEWDRISALLAEKSVVQSRKIQRFLYSGAGEAKPDKQGRVLVPPPLRKYANLTHEVVVIGVGRYAEIWDADAWQAMNDALDSKSIEEAMEELDF